MNKMSSVRNRLAVTTLLLGMGPLAHAHVYKIQEITRAEAGNATYTINGGNQSLNNKGQIIGISRQYTQDKVYHFGDRAFLWDTKGMRELGNLGSDANKYALSIPVGINNQGQVAGRSTYFVKGIDQGLRACLWENGKTANLSVKDPGFVGSEAVAINSNGWVMGTGLFYDRGMDKGFHIVLWGNGNTQDIANLPPYGSVNAFNNNNQIIGFYDAGFDAQGNWLGNHTFLLAGGTFKDLGTKEAGIELSTPVAINDNNAVIIASDHYDFDWNWLGSHAFIWIDGKAYDLGALGVDASGIGSAVPIAINNNNQVIGTSTVFDDQGNGTGSHGFLWESGKMVDLGALGFDGSGMSTSLPYAINASGQVVGFSTYSENGVAKGYRAFLYQNKTMVDLNSMVPANSGLVLENALAINDKGQITAYGTKTIGAESFKVYVLLTPS